MRGAAQRYLLLGFGKLAFELTALIDEGFEAFDDAVGPRLQERSGFF